MARKVLKSGRAIRIKDRMISLRIDVGCLTGIMSGSYWSPDTGNVGSSSHICTKKPCLNAKRLNPEKCSLYPKPLKSYLLWGGLKSMPQTGCNQLGKETQRFTEYRAYLIRDDLNTLHEVFSSHSGTLK